MKTTKVFFFSLLFFLAAATVSAQRGEPRDPVADAERQTERLATVLDLTPEQAAKVKAINLAYAERAQASRKEADEDRKARREAMEATREAHNAEVKAVLTPEQVTKLEALEAQRKERREERGKKPDRG